MENSWVHAFAEGLSTMGQANSLAQNLKSVTNSISNIDNHSLTSVSHA